MSRPLRTCTSYSQSSAGEISQTCSDNTIVEVCDMTIFDRGRLKVLHDLLLKKYRSIVLQHTFCQLQFWRLRLYIVYNTTYSGRVTLIGHCTYSRSQKYICIQALPIKRFIRALVWRPLFWAHTPEARALKPCQTAPDYWTKLSFKLIRSKHTRFYI